MTNPTKKLELWKDFITRVHIFCGQEDQTDTSDLELIFDQIIRQTRKEAFEEGYNLGRKKYEKT